MFDHASIHTPCTAQPILQPKVKKTSVQEIKYVIIPYNRISRYIACASCYILRYTTLYFESGWSRLANPFWLGSTLAPGFACSSIMISLGNSRYTMMFMVYTMYIFIYRRMYLYIHGIYHVYLDI